MTWEPGRHAQNIHYLHGALHIFDAQTEVQKYTGPTRHPTNRSDSKRPEQ